MSMHRHLSRAARRSLRDSYNARKQPQWARNNAVEIVQSSQGFSSSHDHYNFGWRDQAGTKYAQLQIVNALRMGERKRASKMLLNIGHMDGSLSADDFAYILDYCARTPDPLFVMETTKVMEEKAIDVNKRCCRFIIQAFSKGGYLKEAFNWLTFLGENVRVHGVMPMYNIFLRECGNTKSLIYADSCLELMESQLMGKSEITYWELLKLAVLQKNVSAVHDIWKDCTRYYSPSIITLRKFIWSFTRLRDLESAYSALQHMVALASQGSVSLRMSTAGRYQSSRLDIPIPSINDLSHEKFGLDRKCSINLLCEGNIVEIKEGSEKSCRNICNSEKQSLYNIGENRKLDGAIPSLSHVAKTPDVFFNESRFSNEIEKDIYNPRMFLPLAGAAGVDYQYFAVKQEDCTQISMDNMKQGSRYNVLREISVPVMNILRWSFNDIIHACAQSKNCELAEQLFLQMHDLGMEPSQHTYDGFVKAAIYGKGVAYGMKVIELMEKRNVKPYNDTLAALSIGHSKQLELDLAEALLEKISDSLPKYVHPFNAFLAACDAMDEPGRAVRMLVKMKRSDIKPNIRTYEILFSLFGHVNVPYETGNMLSHADVSKRINTIEMDMMKNGIQHSYTSMKNLIRALGAEGMIQKMLQYLNVAENMLWHTNSYQRSDMYDIVLHALVKAKESQSAIEVFKNMRLCDLPASVATYNIMIECCSPLKCFKSASALVSMMLRHGFFPQRLTYTALIKVLLENDDFDGALNLLDQSSSEGIEPDIQLFNTILREAYVKGRIDIIEQIVERIHQIKIQPDPSTCWYTFSAYVESGFHSTALEALQVLSMRMISEESSILQEQMAAFDELIHNEDPDAESRIVDIFEESQEYLATALLNLRWCAVAGRSISWLPEESPWAQRLSSCYGARNGAT